MVIEIYTETESLEAHGTVARIEPRRGMGLTFDEMPPSFVGVLNKWVEQAHGRKVH